MGWTVQNVGSGGADHPWADEVVLQQVGQPSSQYIVMGTFDNFNSLAPGYSYTRTETVTVPSHITGLYNVEVITNYDGSLFENGATSNNTGIASPALTVTVTPRPDLQVAEIDVPATVNAGADIFGYLQVDQCGNRPDDQQLGRQGLSFTHDLYHRRIHPDPGPAQPGGPCPGDEYQATTVPVVVPERLTARST